MKTVSYPGAPRKLNPYQNPAKKVPNAAVRSLNFSTVQRVPTTDSIFPLPLMQGIENFNGCTVSSNGAGWRFNSLNRAYPLVLPNQDVFKLPYACANEPTATDYPRYSSREPFM